MPDVDPDTQNRILDELREPDGPDRYRQRLMAGKFNDAKRAFVEAELERIDREDQAAVAAGNLALAGRSADAAERSATAAEQANDIARRASVRAWVAIGIAGLSAIIALAALFRSGGPS